MDEAVIFYQIISYSVSKIFMKTYTFLGVRKKKLLVLHILIKKKINYNFYYFFIQTLRLK